MISKFEKGERKPTREQIDGLAATLGIDDQANEKFAVIIEQK